MPPEIRALFALSGMRVMAYGKWEGEDGRNPYQVRVLLSNGSTDFAHGESWFQCYERLAIHHRLESRDEHVG